MAQTEHDFNLEKQMIVTNATLRMKQEYERKKKDLQIQMLMYGVVVFAAASLRLRSTCLDSFSEVFGAYCMHCW